MGGTVMKEPWLDKLRARILDGGGAKAPEGLLDDVKAEMKRRGIAPLSAQRQKAKTIPMWGRRAASVAAVLVCGVCLWQLLEQQQPDTHQLARQPSESGGAESAGHSFKSGQTEDHTLQLPVVSSGRPLASFVARKGEPERSEKRVAVAGPNAGEGTQVAVSPDGRMETEGGKRGNDSATPKTNSATKPGTDTRKPREWAEPEENRGRFGGETGGSRFCVSTAYGGSVGASNGAQGILLASAEPIGDYDREFSGGNTRKNITGSDEVRTETKHRQPVKFGVLVRYSIDGRWGVQAGVTYSYLSSKFSYVKEAEASVAEQRLHYVGVPVAVSYSVLKIKGLNLYAVAGGEVEKLVKGELGRSAKGDNDAGVSTGSVKEGRPQFSVRAAVGAEYRIGGEIGAYVEPGVSYHFNNGSGVENIYKERPANFSLNMGLRIHINR